MSPLANIQTLNVFGIENVSNLQASLSNLTLANVTTLVSPLANVVLLNTASEFVGSLNVSAISNLNSLVAPLANVVLLNTASEFVGSLNVSGTSNLTALVTPLANVVLLNTASEFVGSLNVSSISNLTTLVTPLANITVLNTASEFVGSLNVSGISNLTTLITPVANVTTLNVSSLETTGNLSVSGNIIPVTQGNTYVQGNVVVSGNVYSSLGELGVGGSLFFSLGAPYTPGYFTGNVPVTGTLTNTIRISAFTQQGTSTYIRTSANGCFKFTQTGVYTLASNFLTNFNNILGIGIGSNVIDYGTRTDQTYLYSLIPFISQNPTAILEAQFYVSDLTKYYYVDAFSVDGVELQPTSSPSGTWISVAPLGGVAAASQTVVLSTLGATVTGQGTNYGAQITDYYIGCSAGISVSLPNGATLTAGKQYVIKDESGNAAVNHITIQPYTGNLIDGQTSLVLVISYGAVTLYWTGARWSIV